MVTDADQRLVTAAAGKFFHSVMSCSGVYVVTACSRNRPSDQKLGSDQTYEGSNVSRVDARLSPRHVGTPYAGRRPGEEVAAPFTPGHKEASKPPRGKSAA